MYEFITKIILASKLKIIGWYRWKQILNENGISKPGALSEQQLDLVILKIFKSLFKESEKNKKLKLDSLGKTYENGFKAVHNFTLQVDPGDFVCLLGPSGCGKTTALRMIAGLEYITEGTYSLGNKEMNSIHPSERQTAMVFQNYALYPFMTVYNNIAFGLKLKTTKNDIVKQNIDKLILQKQPNLEKIKDAKFKLWELRNPYFHEINTARIKLKKSNSKEFNVNESKLLKAELNKYLDDAQKLKNSNQTNEILKIKAEIANLKKEQIDLVRTQKKSLQLKKTELISQIKDLEIKQNNYKIKKQSSIPKIQENIVKLKKEKKVINNEYNKTLKEYSKFAKKTNKDNNNYIIVKKKINAIEKKLEAKEELIQFEKNKIFAINNSQQVEIQNLKNKLYETKLVKQQILDAAIIWKNSIPARVRELSALVGIKNFLKRKPSALSGGQRQRVALIRAISKDAQLFLFDEPLSNLDAKLRGTMRSEIRKIHERIGATSLYVTHDQIEAMTMANKVVIMNVGYIQQVGTPKDLYDNPSNAFVARFIGTPTINMIKGKMKDVSTFSVDKKTNIKVKFNAEQKKNLSKYKNKDVLLGIRPHHIYMNLSNKKSAGSISAEIIAIELVGSEYVLSVKTESIKSVRVLIPATHKVKKNQKVQLSFDSEHTFIFDATTGTSLTSKINEPTRAALNIWEESIGERIANKVILDSERNSSSVSKKLSNEVRAVFDKKYKVGLIHKKVELNNKKVEDYSLVETDEDESVES